jgi:DNA-binding transcriptional regulator YhcF (GntR family)
MTSRGSGSSDRPQRAGWPDLMVGGLGSLAVDATSSDPPYDQIRTQITRLVSAGQLAPGERLPTVRTLATTLGVAANTVARAYRELEHRGLVITRGRLGTVVAGDSVERAAREAAADLVVQMRALNLDNQQILEHVHRALSPPKSS